MKRLKNTKMLMMMLIDVILVNLSYLTAFYFKYGNEILGQPIIDYKKSVLLEYIESM